MGINPQTIAFNQNLVNYQLEENKTLEENLEKIINDYDYNVSFCNDPTQTDTKRYVMPKSFKEKGVTAEELIRKYIGSVGGNMLTLPIKEYAKKISICTRANLNQGCSVFYLGKGLYEGYSITGQVDPSVFNQNYQYQTQLGLGFEYDRASLGENEKYTLDNIYPNTRKEKLKNAKTNLLDFDPQFTELTKRYSNNLSSSGFVWRENGPEVTTERRQSTNMFGIGVNGEKPIAMLDGKVVSVSKDGGNVTIGTNYFLRFCKKDKKDCRNKAIYQETQNLTKVEDKLVVGAEVKINEQIGTATADKPEFVRFYILNTNSSDIITLVPAIVWSYAVPAKALTDEELKNIGLNKTESNSPSGPATPATPGSSGFIGRVGSTGGSSGAHLHAEWEDQRFIDVAQVREFVKVPGNLTSSYDDPTRSRHKGVDIGGNNREPIELINGATLAEIVETNCTKENDRDDTCGGRFGNHVKINTPKGVMILAHLAPGSVTGTPGGIRNGSRYGRGVQSGPAPIGVEVSTEFRGVPRALRIIPGRTILSLITRYDEWVEQGRPAEIDPGIWIAGRFSKWFIKNARYNWSQGDLRVGITGISDWGNITSRIKVPTFEEYVQSFKLTGEFEKTNDYYGYIRSLGDLCWKYNETKSSCEVLCDEAQRFQEYFNRAGIGAGVTGSFPNSQCEYEGSVIANKQAASQIMGMLRSVGISSKNAYAGVLGNGMAESTLNFDVHNSGKPGEGCSSTPSSLLGVVGYGLFQWCGSRAEELAASGKCGKNCSFQQQLEFTANEIKTGRNISQQCIRRDWIKEINEASTPQRAADIWNECYERGPGGIGKRQNFARDIEPGLKCQRIND
jgi:hypothetical protein